jgi:hypothetical protein
MAVMNLETVLPQCPTAAKRVVAGMVRKGSVQVNGLIPANLSYSRHLFARSMRLSQARHNPVDHIDAGNTALRAGRPAGKAGVLVSCRSALCESRAAARWTQEPRAKRAWPTPSAGTPTPSTRGTMSRNASR